MKEAVRRGGRSYGLRAPVAVGVAGLLMAGCSSNPAPAPLADPVTPPSTTVSPSPVSDASADPTGPPVMPAIARGTGAKSAKAFVRYWIDGLNYAAISGDTDILRRASARSCSACSAIADFIDDVYRREGWIKGLGWDPISLRLVSVHRGPSVVVDVTVTVKPQRVRRRAGATIDRFRGGRRLKTFWLRRGSDQWTVVRLDQAT